MLEHGGKLRAAAARYGIPLEQWLDLSTGINPNGWQGAMPPPSSWARLPEDEDGLSHAACNYYGTAELLPVAGSQAAIQVLPKLRAECRVAVLAPSYNEHAHAWQGAGHAVDLITADQLDTAVESHDVVVVVNPNNPTGVSFDKPTLLPWHQKLAARGGWLLVDEAFMDSTPANSVAAHTGEDGLIVLRSLGKFFGLAGARVGFVLAETTLLQQLREELGPWTISGPARWLATKVLNDRDWQGLTREQLKQHGQRLNRLLTDHGLSPDGDTALFQSIATPLAESIHERLAEQGILTRLFNDQVKGQVKDQALIRFGLPAHEVEWQRLETALAQLQLTAVQVRSA
jgi:cobalamin biosynthetic protein CobC